MTYLRAYLAGVALLTGCGEGEIALGGGTDTDGPDLSPTTQPDTPTPVPTWSGTGTTDPTLTTSISAESSGSSESGDSSTTGEAAPAVLDILVVVDNSRGTAAPQAELAEAAPALVDGLLALSADADINVMVTTTDVGNPVCEQFKPKGYAAARGAPVGSACRMRLDDFIEISPPFEQGESCTAACPRNVAPDGAVLHFNAEGDNVPDGSASEALQCILPQGVNGCGHESPLEAMHLALDPEACWNDPDCAQDERPFLRAGADLAVVVVTTELDCSAADPGMFSDEQYYNVHPHQMLPLPSSALCFNAGVECNGPDEDGLYTGCAPREEGPMAPVSRYVQRLVDEFGAEGKRVHFVPIVGVDVENADVTEYRAWRDSDLLPPDIELGMSVDDKTWELGLGPGCARDEDVGGYTQALPPVRIAEVCDGVELAGGSCCMSSICEPGFGSAIECLLESL